MMVELLTDLTNYDPLFTKGAIGTCDMVPFCHPNIRWQLCYNMVIDGHELAIGESSLKVIKEDCDPEIQEKHGIANAEFASRKLELSEILDKTDFILLFNNGTAYRSWYLYSLENRTIINLGETSYEENEFLTEENRRIFASFVEEYCRLNGKWYADVQKTSKQSILKVFINGKEIHNETYKTYEQALDELTKLMNRKWGYIRRHI